MYKRWSRNVFQQIFEFYATDENNFEIAIYIAAVAYSGGPLSHGPFGKKSCLP